MSQSGVLDVAGSNPQIPTSFVTDAGIAIPIANVLEILGGANVSTSGSGNTVTITVAGSFGETITGNSGGPLSPTLGNWNVIGVGSLTTSGAGSTLSISLTGITNHAVQLGGSSNNLDQSNLGLNGQLLIGSNGADPAFASLTSTGGTVSFTAGPNSLNLEAGASVPIQFTTDSGIATPALGNLNILGSGSIATSGAGSTVTTALQGLTNHSVLVGAGTSTITKVAPSATTGVPLISQGAAADPVFGTALVAGGGTGSTSFTTYGPVVAASSSTGALTSVAPSATSGVPFISQGAAANPAFGTAVVAGGGTGVTSNTAYAVLCGGTTSTNPIQSIASVGTSGQVLTSNGAAALPTFQTVSTNATGFVAFASSNLVGVTGDDTYYLIQFNATSRNDGTMYATGTGIATIPSSGLWLFNATVDIRLVVLENVAATFLIEANGGPQNGNVQVNAFPCYSTNGRLCLSTTCLLALSATNTVGVRLQVTGNGSKNITLAGSGTSLLTSFSGAKLGT